MSTFIDKLNKYCKEKKDVEIITTDDKNHVVSGRIVEVGDDYISVSSSIEQDVQETVNGENGKETQTRRVIYKVETTLRLEIVTAASQIQQRIYR